MPRTGPRRPYVGVRLDPAQLDAIDTLAEREGLNRSETVRLLVSEALESRSRSPRR